MLYTDYLYEHPLNWLTYLENRDRTNGDDPGKVVFSSFQYYENSPGDGHDLVGNRLRLEAQLKKPDGTFASPVSVYNYDEAYQLAKETRTVDNAKTTEWKYDAAGNRLSQIVDSSATTSYTYNDANQLLTESAATQTWYYEFDEAGNMRFKKDHPDTPTINYEWQYNSENRLTGYDDPVTANDATYTYNALGNRVKTEVSTTVKKFLFDGADCVADYDGSASLLAYYVTPGLDANLLMQADSADYYYAQDGLGSVKSIIDISQDVTHKYDYSAWGEQVAWDTATAAPDNRYTYTGREWDTESESQHSRWRTLFPTLGRFGTRDPLTTVSRSLRSTEDTQNLAIAAMIQLYSYVASNPCMNVDQLGLEQNCIGHTLSLDKWIWPWKWDLSQEPYRRNPELKKLHEEANAQHFWPTDVPKNLSINAFSKLYEKYGWKKADSCKHECDIQKVAVYTKSQTILTVDPKRAKEELKRSGFGPYLDSADVYFDIYPDPNRRGIWLGWYVIKLWFVTHGAIEDCKGGWTEKPGVAPKKTLKKLLPPSSPAYGTRVTCFQKTEKGCNSHLAKPEKEKKKE